MTCIITILNEVTAMELRGRLAMIAIMGLMVQEG